MSLPPHRKPSTRSRSWTGNIAWTLGFLLCCASQAPAQDPTSSPNPSSDIALISPVDAFNQLLAKSPAEREQLLATKPDAQRQIITAKIKEYEAISPEQRELRLRATRLRWQLGILMRLSPTNRAERLAQLPEPDRKAIEERLRQWDQLPPSIQKILLANEFNATGGHRLQGIPSAAPVSNSASGAPSAKKAGSADAAQWDSLTPEQRERTLKRFHQFFELTEAEKEKILRLLNEDQRQQAQNTIQVMQSMPAPQRQDYLRSLNKFSDLPPTDKERYRLMAEEWNQLKPEERQHARSYAAQLPIVPPGAPQPAPASGFLPNTRARSLPPLPGSITNTNKPPPMVGIDTN